MFKKKSNIILDSVNAKTCIFTYLILLSFTYKVILFLTVYYEFRNAMRRCGKTWDAGIQILDIDPGSAVQSTSMTYIHLVFPVK